MNGLTLRHLWGSLKSSLWFVPSLMVVGTIILAYLVTEWDKSVDFDEPGAVGFIFGGSADGAREVLSTIASSMITVAGVVFSITILALSLASQQFGPRLLRNFMRDRGNQLVLGTFISTYLYCLLVLRTVTGDNGASFLPNIGVSVALLLAIISLAVLIYYIHHIAESINASHLIAGVYRELEDSINTLYPEHIGEERPPVEEAEPVLPQSAEHAPTLIYAARSGYVQSVESAHILRLAQENDLLIQIMEKPGHFVHVGSPIAQVWPIKGVSKEIERRIQSYVRIGSRRTPVQDHEFMIDQLVEIALRALSPSLNDSFTAITCVDYLSAALASFADRKIPSPYRKDRDGIIRVVTISTSFGQAIDSSFNQIRQSAAGHADVLIRMQEALHRLARSCRTERQLDDVLRHAKMIYELTQDLRQEPDRLDAEGRHESVVRAAEDRRKEVQS